MLLQGQVRQTLTLALYGRGNIKNFIFGQLGKVSILCFSDIACWNYDCFDNYINGLKFVKRPYFSSTF